MSRALTATLSSLTLVVFTGCATEPPVQREPSAAELLLSSRAKFKRRDFDGAIADLTRAIATDPTSAVAWAGRSMCHERKREHDAAVADATRAIELDPKISATWRARGAARAEGRRRRRDRGLHEGDRARLA